MIIYKPPHQVPEAILATASTTPKVFLAGTIEMGAAVDWQRDIETALTNYQGLLFNPRRDDWDSSWVQDESNPVFREQVEWELDHLELADVAVVHFCPGTLSPITLLELGLFALHSPSKLIVHCPEGFWRKGNVDIVCNKYKLEKASNFEDLIQRVEQRLTDRDQ